MGRVLLQVVCVRTCDVGLLCHIFRSNNGGGEIWRQESTEIWTHTDTHTQRPNAQSELLQ